MWSRNSRVTASIDILGQAIRCFILDSWSIITIIFLQPLLSGSPIIKLIKIFFYLQFRAESGFKSLLYMSADIATRDIPLCYIVHIQLVILLLK